MFHMKYCDYDLFVETANRRNSFVEEQQKVGDGKLRTNPLWFAKSRNDEQTFQKFMERPVVDDFDLSHVRNMMHDTWGPRGPNFWHHDKPEYDELYKIPDRFAGADVV